MRKGKTVGRRLLLTLLVIAMLFTTALAEESPQEMVSDLATNTAAWLMATDAGDTENNSSSASATYVVNAGEYAI